jgi:hypothetical protein
MKTAASQNQQPIEKRVAQQVRRDLMIFAGFIAAGFILSVNLDVVGLIHMAQCRRRDVWRADASTPPSPALHRKAATR